MSAGGTREPLDPVRYLGNRSSGKQGYAIARAAVARGAAVTLVAANVSLPVPEGVELVTVETTLELKDAVEEAADGADVVVMAAAPADFRPASASDTRSRRHPTARRRPRPAPRPRREPRHRPRARPGAGATRGAARPLVVSFAAETGDADGSVMDHARAKFARKGSDLQVVNEVGRDLTFGHDDTTVHLLRRDSDEVATVGPASKDAVAGAVLDVVEQLLR